MTTKTKTGIVQELIGPSLLRNMREAETEIGRLLTQSEESAFRCAFLRGYSEALGFANGQLKEVLDDSR